MPHCHNPDCSYLNEEANINRVPKRLGKNDTHDLCLRCLGPDHDVRACEVCKKFHSRTRNQRAMAVAAFKRTGRWPSVVNAKSLDRERSRESSATQGASSQLSKAEAMAQSMSDLSKSYAAKGYTTKKASHEVKAREPSVPTLIPPRSPTPPVEEMAQEDPIDLHPNQEQEFELINDKGEIVSESTYVEETGIEIARKAMLPEGEQSEEDSELDEEEEYTEELDSRVQASQIVHNTKPQDPDLNNDPVKVIPLEREVDPNWKPLSQVVVDNSLDPRTSKDRSKSSEVKVHSRSPSHRSPSHHSGSRRSRSPGRRGHISLHNRSRSRSRSRSRHSRRHKRRYHRRSYSSSSSSSPGSTRSKRKPPTMEQMMDCLVGRIDTAVSKAMQSQKTTTQSVAPEAVKSIPMGQMVEEMLHPRAPAVPRLPNPPAPSIRVDPEAVPPTQSRGASSSYPSRETLSSDSDSDSDSEKGPHANVRKSRRRKWVPKVYDYLPDLTKPIIPVAGKSDQWWGVTPKSSGHDFPSLPLHSAVKDQLNSRIDTHFKRSKSSRKSFNPSKTYNKIYRTPDSTHFALTSAHSVSATFLAEMRPEAVSCSQVGIEARLKKNSAAGKAEATCLGRQDRATTAFRIINSVQLNNAAKEQVFQQLQDQINEFHSTSLVSSLIPTLPAGNALRKELNELLSIVRHTENAITLVTEETQDSRQSNSDLFSIHATEYIEATADRRKLWLDNSRIRLDVQRELASMPIDTFSDTTKDPGDLLGARATLRLTQELESRAASTTFKMSEATLQAVTKTGNFKANPKPNQSSNKQSKNQKKKKQNNQSGAQSTETPPFRGNDTRPRGGQNQRGGRRNQSGRGNNTPKKGGKKGSTD